MKTEKKKNKKKCSRYAGFLKPYRFDTQGLKVEKQFLSATPVIHII